MPLSLVVLTSVRLKFKWLNPKFKIPASEKEEFLIELLLFTI